jgi:cwf21 domain
MSSNVGLSTPRGSGTSGYVQRNLSLLKPRDNAAPYPKDWDNFKHRQRQPDKEILEHDRRREIEVKVFELRDRLEDEGYAVLATCAFSFSTLTSTRFFSVDEDEIEDQCTALRKKLEAERQRGKNAGPNARGLKSHQVHELAKAKIEESEKLRKALGIREDYEEGSHWRKQEERLRESMLEKGKEEARREETRKEDSE